MQQPTQPVPESDAEATPTEVAIEEPKMTTAAGDVPDVPMECPLSHRVARKASVTIIAALCVLIAATMIYVLTSGSG